MIALLMLWIAIDPVTIWQKIAIIVLWIVWELHDE